MFERLRAAAPDEADEALATYERLTGVPFRDTLERNVEIQLAVFLATLAYCAVLERRGLTAAASAGLSLGEYNHLVHIGALDRASAVDLIAARGRAYDEGPDGIMMAVQPTNPEELAPYIEAVRSEMGIAHGDLAISNVNSPRQVVVAGRADAVERLVAAIDDELYPDAVLIEKRIPMHTARFAPVAHAFRPALEAVPWGAPTLAWWSNVLGAPVLDPGPARFVDLLCRHVSEPVLWQQIVDGLLTEHPGAVVVEVGPRHVLRDLIRGWRRKTPVFSLDPFGDQGFEDVLQEIERARN